MGYVPFFIIFGCFIFVLLLVKAFIFSSKGFFIKSLCIFFCTIQKRFIHLLHT